MTLIKKLFPSIKNPYDKSAARILNRLAALFVLLELIKVVGFVSINIPYLLIIGIILLPVLYIAQSRGLTYVHAYLFYFLYLGLNVLICNPPTVFKSWERLALFIMLMLCVSPAIQNDVIRNFRFTCLKYLLNTILVLVLISFVCFFLGINFNSSRFAIGQNFSHAGVFGGLFWSSMILGPLSAIATCYTVWLYLVTENRTWILIAIASAGATLFSASRSAVYGGVIGCIIVFLFFNKKRSNGVRRLLMLVIAACVTFPIWEGALVGINQKNAANTSMGEYGSRTEKFEARIDEIQSSPIMGVGFASIDIYGKDVYDPNTGTVEPGSSWLCTMSMTGIIGFLFVLNFFLMAFRTSKRAQSRFGSLMCGLIAFFAFHFMFEGYVLAGGSVLCFIAWLVLGVGTDFKYEYE